MNISHAKTTFLGLAMATGIAACSSNTTDRGPFPQEPVGGGEQTSTVSYELRLGRTTHITKASYAITCPGGFSKSGTIDVSKLSELEGSISGLPPGGPCALTLTATSTNGNVTCSGSKGGLTVTCPGNRAQDENHFKVTCTRLHEGREWGDNDWKENARTFQLGAELNLLCATPDGGSDACTPRTTCPAGDNCGTVPDGCGGTVNCGTCAVPGGCTANRCEVCHTTCATLGATCGSVPDGCGGVLFCGTCPSGQTCGGGGAANQCGSGPAGCGLGSSTLSCLATQDSPTSTPTAKCSTCAQANGCLDPAFQGGTCESLTANATLFPGTLPDGKTCSQVVGSSPASERAVCFQTLRSVFASGCASSLQQTPCVCGTTEVSACLTGTATPTGPLYDEYACDFNSTNVATINTISTDFTVQTFGAGMANSIVQCAEAFGCECFPPCLSGTPGSCGCTPTPPATACGSNTCGTAPDGCGGTVPCGTCGSGQVCNAGSCCTPRTPVCPAGAVCGSVSDGCGGVSQCGSCPVGLACGSDGQCHQGCGGVNASTLSCLQTRDKPTSSANSKCSTCVQAAGCLDPALLGGTCESLAANANLFPGTLPDGKTCGQVVGPSPVSERAVCFQTLGSVFVSGCASSLQETPCVCGTTAVSACVAGTATPNGPLYDEYACDFNGASFATINAVWTDFTVQTFGAGMANSIVQCASAFACDCF